MGNLFWVVYNKSMKANSKNKNKKNFSVKESEDLKIYKNKKEIIFNYKKSINLT